MKSSDGLSGATIQCHFESFRKTYIFNISSIDLYSYYKILPLQHILSAKCLLSLVVALVRLSLSFRSFCSFVRSFVCSFACSLIQWVVFSASEIRMAQPTYPHHMHTIGTYRTFQTTVCINIIKYCYEAKEPYYYLLRHRLCDCSTV